MLDPPVGGIVGEMCLSPKFSSVLAKLKLYDNILMPDATSILYILYILQSHGSPMSPFSAVMTILGTPYCTPLPHLQKGTWHA